METKIKDVDISTDWYSLEIKDGFMKIEPKIGNFETLTEIFAHAYELADNLDELAEKLDDAGINWKTVSEHCRKEIKDKKCLERIFANLYDNISHHIDDLESYVKEGYFEDPYLYLKSQTFGSISKQVIKDIWENARNTPWIDEQEFVDTYYETITIELDTAFTFDTMNEFLCLVSNLFDDELKKTWEGYTIGAYVDSIKREFKDMSRPKK